MKNEGIIYNDVKKIANPPTEQEIISRLCGGDLTDGSCSSLAFAYAGNKGGYDVLDFRGGNSCNQFSDNDNINRIVTICGGMVESNGIGYDNAIANLNRVQKGKEYYFGAGLHSAVIRRNDKGQIEYLELQAPKEKNNKWQKLTDKKLYH